MTEITQADTHIISMTVAAFKTSQAQSRMEERAAIVAWLRDRKEMTAFYIDYVETAQAAAAIEAGEHIK